MTWIFNNIILIGGFLFARKLLILIDKELAPKSQIQKAPLWFALIYLFCVSFFQLFALDCVFWIILALAAYNDYLTYEIYDIVYLPAIITCLIQLFNGNVTESLVELIVFVLLQFLLFRRYYGLSDCIAFSVCAMYLTIHGGLLLDSIILVFVTLLFLGVVQLCKKNVNRKGNLNKSVAMIPYIAVVMFCLQLI